MARNSPQSPRIVTAWCVGSAVAISLFLTSCGKLRSPEQLLNDPALWTDSRAAARAEELFRRNCSICHGEAGKGDGRYFATGLKPAPADLTLTGPDALDLDDLRKWIRVGSAGFDRSTLCPPWGYTFTDDEIADLARFVFSLRDGASPVADADATDQDTETGTGDRL